MGLVRSEGPHFEDEGLATQEDYFALKNMYGVGETLPGSQKWTSTVRGANRGDTVTMPVGEMTRHGYSRTPYGGFYIAPNKVRFPYDAKVRHTVRTESLAMASQGKEIARAKSKLGHRS